MPSKKLIRPRALDSTAFPGPLLAMLSLIKAMLVSILTLLRSRRNLVLENLALRHQLAVLNRTAKHRRFSNADRFF